MKSILIQAWAIVKKDQQYFLPYSHWVYLSEIVKYYDEVRLLSPVDSSDRTSDHGLLPIKDFSTVKVIELPYSPNYISSTKHFRSFWNALKNNTDVEVTYARYPVPFGWLHKVFFPKNRRIIHFVGDPIDAAKTNPNFSRLKRLALTTFFLPEHLMYMWACKGSIVYTNGYHLSDRIKKFGINATSLISTTLGENDFFLEENKIIDPDGPKLVYVGYLRKAKGVETVLRSFKLVQQQLPKAELTIVGSGEFETQLRQISQEEQLQNVVFCGHVDNRDTLNKILRSHDIFCFASLSEGSPRVILEAMANGINVVSTPVGSLPAVFEDGKNIVFADYNNPTDFFNKITWLVNNVLDADSIRTRAFAKAKEFTIKNFINTIFNEA